MFGVIAKLSGGRIEYVKAKEADEIYAPVLEEQYVFLNVITSPVKAFVSIDKGKYLITTRNSMYLCWLDEWDNVVAYAKNNELPEGDKHNSGSVYFGFDNRFKKEN